MNAIPKDRSYTTSHEWVRIEAGRASVGITEHAQHELGDLVFADPAPVGKVLRAGDSVATLESVKAASDAYAPLAGTVLTSNRALYDDPSLLNSDPYGQPLVVLALPADADPTAAGLLDAAAYAALIGAKE
jgi:glycine cleavage system H protein